MNIGRNWHFEQYISMNMIQNTDISFYSCVTKNHIYITCLYKKLQQISEWIKYIFILDRFFRSILFFHGCKTWKWCFLQFTNIFIYRSILHVENNSGNDIHNNFPWTFPTVTKKSPGDTQINRCETTNTKTIRNIELFPIYSFVTPCWFSLLINNNSILIIRNNKRNI